MNKIVISNKRYKITKKGNSQTFYQHGSKYGKAILECLGPVWRLWRKTWFFGWVQDSVTNMPRVVKEWKERYFSNE